MSLAPTRAHAVPAVLPPAALTDADGNRISDDLEHDLAGMLGAALVEVIVRIPGSADPVAAAEAIAGPLVDPTAIPLIDGLGAGATVAQIRLLAADPSVFRVEANRGVELTIESARTDTGVDRALADFGHRGEGVGVCVIDSGADPLHEQLDDGKIVGWLDMVDGRTEPYDDEPRGHGTHVASILAGDGVGVSPLASSMRGVAPDAELYVVKAFDATGSPPQQIVTAARAIEWCATQPGVDIISMSFTKSDFAVDGTDAMSEAARRAVVDYGKVAVAAAGNGGATPFNSPSTLGAPAVVDEVIAVGAVADFSAGLLDGSNEGLYLAPISSRGPTLDGRIKPDVVAPGIGISAAGRGTVIGYTEKSGTSMATPFVAGAVALAISAEPGIDVDEIRSLIQSTAVDLGAPGKDNDWGAGLLDTHRFVGEAGDFQPPAAGLPLPDIEEVSGTIATPGTVFRHEFEVVDIGVPIAVTMLIDGGPALLPIYWEPDLDARLIDPLGLTADSSTCGLATVPDETCAGASAASGRQETLEFMPILPGTYAVEVAASPLTPTVTGSFSMTISHGPIQPRIYPEPATATEGDVVSFVLRRTGDVSLSDAVQYRTRPRSAVPGADFTGSGWRGIRFPPGVSEVTINVPTRQDTVAEGDETFVLALRNPYRGTLASTRTIGTIIDDDGAPAVVHVGDVEVIERRPARVALTRTGDLRSVVHVRLVTHDVDARDGTDYRHRDRLVRIPANRSSVIVAIPTIDDPTPEPVESFEVTALFARNAVLGDAHGVVTVYDDDHPLPEISMAVDDVDEGADFSVVVTRTGAAPGVPSSVTVRTANRSAVQPADYTRVVERLTFAPGETTKIVSVPTHVDGIVEGDQVVRFVLASPSMALLPSRIIDATIRDVP